MTITISRLYNDYSTAAKVVAELKAAGLREGEISIIANNAENWYSADQKRDAKATSGRVDRDHDGTDDRAEGAATGAGVGAGVGSAVGLLAGLGMLAIPGIGPVVAAGWLASTLAVGAAGAATGGLIGALTGAGVSEDDANVYAEGVRRGGTLVTARVDDNRAAAADEVMRRNNPMDTRKLSSEYRSSGWTGFDQQGGSDRIVAGFETQDRARAARDALTSG